MFTGLIETTAEVQERTPSSLTIERPKGFSDVKEGSSIAVSGVCLTIAKLTKESMQFDVTEETWSRTTLGSLQKGDRINLERALSASDRFEGHIVQGHVDGVGQCENVKIRKYENELSIRYPKELRGLIVEKGSIAMDGVSLTVVQVDEETFSVALIPLTLQATTFGSLRTGSRVNLEADIIGKYVRKMA